MRMKRVHRRDVVTNLRQHLGGDLVLMAHLENVRAAAHQNTPQHSTTSKQQKMRHFRNRPGPCRCVRGEPSAGADVQGVAVHTRSLPICWCALVTESAHEIGLFHYRVELLCREYTAVPARQMARWMNIMSAPVCRWLQTQRRMQHKPLQRSDHAALRCNLSAGRIASATGVAKERPADCAVQSKSIPPVGGHRSCGQRQRD